MEETSSKPGRIFYNISMAKDIRKVKPPYKGIVVDVRARPNYLALVVYEENIMEYEVDQRVNIMEYLLMLREIIQSHGVRCELEGATGSARRG
jgi:hypothetical protein